MPQIKNSVTVGSAPLPVDGGMWSNRVGAAVDSTQASLYGIAEAAGIDSARGLRLQNESDARAEQVDARRQGAVDSYKDVSGIRSGLNYIGGLAIQSAPQMGLVAGGALLGGPVGAFAAGHVLATGDILDNQREQNGTTNLPAALGLAVPYALVDSMTGVGGKITKLASRGEGAAEKAAAKEIAKATADASMSRTARVAREAGKTALEEGVGETAQEVFNQAGRMAVDPNATLTDPGAIDRYGESFVGGAALGGVFGGVGGIRTPRIPGVAPTPTVDERGGADLLNPAPAPAAPQSYPLATQGSRGVAAMPTQYTEIKPVDRGGADFAVDANPRLPAPQVQRTTQDYDPSVLAVTPGGTVAPMNQLTGQQPDMFGGPDTFGQGAPQAEQQVQAPQDTATRDMFAENPSAMVRTQFNPATEPAGATSSGVIAATIRSKIAQIAGGGADMSTATKLAIDLSRTFDKPGQAGALLDDAQGKLDKAMKSLDRKVTGGSDMLSPDEYAKQRDVIERRMLSVMAARQVLDEYNKGAVSAYADEGRAKAKPGATVGTKPDNASSVAQQVEFNQAARQTAETESTDARVQAADQGRAQATRADTLARVMADPTVKNLKGKFEAELLRQGVTDFKSTPQELRTMDRFAQSREAFNAEDSAADEPIPSSPNELDPYEAPRKQAAPAPKPQATKNESLHDTVMARLNKLKTSVGDNQDILESLATMQDDVIDNPRDEDTLKDVARRLDTIEKRGFSDGLKYSSGSAVPEGQRVPYDSLQKIADAVAKTVPGAPKIEVADSPAQLFGKDAVPANINPSGAANARGIFLFRDNISSEIEALKTVFHEVFHYGLSRVLGPQEYSRVMSAIAQADPKVREYAERWKASEDGKNRESTMTAQDWNSLAVEEALADVAEEVGTSGTGSKLAPTVRRIVSWAADLANKLGLPKLGEMLRRMTLTEAEKFVQDTMAKADAGVAPKLSEDRNTADPRTTATADNYAALEGVNVSMDFAVDSSDKVVSMEMDAAEALRDLDQRQDALDKLLACIGA